MTIAKVPSPNFHVRHNDILGVVIHCMEGDMSATADWFARGSLAAGNPVSAHYGVAKDGSVVQYVEESDVAYHAGRVEGATARLVLDRPGVNPNLFTIGIEHEGDGAADLTDAQRAASVQLIADICRRHGIPVDRDHIVGHHEIFAPKTCPDRINVDRLVTEAAA